MKLIRQVLLFIVCTLLHHTTNAQTDFSSGFDMFWCGDARIVFNNKCVGNPDSISIVHVHENETTAVRAANWFLDSTNQGCFVTWQCQQQRLVDFKLKKTIYHFDPNRIYTNTGIKATLKLYGNYSDSALIKVNSVAEAFKEKYITGKKAVIALHNNTDGGSLSIASYKRGAAFGVDAKAVFINPKKDVDDFILTTETKFFEKIKRLGYNVVLQDNVRVSDDGSLSVYCGKQHIPYINIEAENGHLQEQQEMLAAIWLLLKD